MPVRLVLMLRCPLAIRVSPVLPVDCHTMDVYSHVDYQHEGKIMKEKTDVLHGPLALMVLRTVDVLGPIHGYGIARRIEEVSKGLLELNQGTIYPSLLQLEQAGW